MLAAMLAACSPLSILPCTAFQRCIFIALASLHAESCFPRCRSGCSCLRLFLHSCDVNTPRAATAMGPTGKAGATQVARSSSSPAALFNAPVAVLYAWRMNAEQIAANASLQRGWSSGDIPPGGPTCVRLAQRSGSSRCASRCGAREDLLMFSCNYLLQKRAQTHCSACAALTLRALCRGL